MPTRSDPDFYAALPVFRGFARIMDPALYTALPEGWVIGQGDVVRSTEAIRAGRYKAVNMAGAALIAAVSNALGGRELPAVFGGDGASFVVPAEDAAVAERALAATVAWCRRELQLELRASMVPVAAVRAAGFDVRVARFAASPDVAYAMFTGGGLAFAELAMKDGRYPVAPAAPGATPDLSGLSCRWEAIPSGQGVTLSLILAPSGSPERFAGLVKRLLALVDARADAVRPLADRRLRLRWPPSGLDLEARTRPLSEGPLWQRRWRLLRATLLSWLVFTLRLTVGGFDGPSYRRRMVANADFRKFDDALRMTLDVTPELARRIEAMLAEAAAEGAARYGLHRQDAALITCLVPSIHSPTHRHFIDGAGGGYAAAAAAMKGG